MKIRESLFTLGLKRNKRAIWLLFFMIMISVIIALFITAFFCSIEKTQENRRTQLYGKWQFAVYQADERVQNRLTNHAIVHHTGKMKIYGEVKQDGAALGNIGTVDWNTKQLGAFTLASGAFPKGDNEIAVERKILEALGVSENQIGQDILLEIQTYNDSGQPETIEKKFKLTGVINNYSSLWKAPENTLLSFIIGETQEERPPLFVNVFCEIQPFYLYCIDELMDVIGDNGRGIINDYTYLELPTETLESSDKSGAITSSILHFILICVTAFVILIFLIELLRHKDKSTQLMQDIGATSDQLLLIYMRCFFAVAFTATLLGTFFGVMLAWLIGKLVSFLQGGAVVFSLPFHKVVLDFIFIFLTVSLSFVLSLIPFLFGRDFVEREECCRHRCKLRRYRNNQKLTTMRMIHIFNRTHRAETIYTLAVICCTCVALSGITFFAYEKYYNYLQLQNSFPMDYVFSGVEPANEAGAGFSHLAEAEVEQLKTSYGIQQVEAYKYSDALSFRPNRNGRVQNLSLPRSLYELEVPSPFVGVSSQPSDIKAFLHMLDLGKVNLKNFYEGKSVILYLPSNCWNGVDIASLGKIDFSSPKRQPMTIEQQNEINVGDVLTVSGPFGSQEVTVDGVIYCHNGTGPFTLLKEPNTIIGSYELAGQLYETPGQPTIELLHIYCENSSNYSSIDEAVSKSLGTLNFQNLRSEKNKASLEAYFCLVFAVFLDLVIFLTFYIIGRGSSLLSVSSIRQRTQDLYVLGMKKSQLFFIQIYNPLIFSIIGSVISFVVLLCFYTLQNFILLFRGNTQAAISFSFNIKTVLQGFFEILPISVCIGFFCLFFILNLLISSMSFFREIHLFRKRKK